jgi:hypothetical protein
MRTYREVDIYRPTFSCPGHWFEVSDQLYAPATLPPWDIAPGAHWIEG